MIPFFIVCLTSILGGFFYRCRGGFLGTGNTFLARFLFWIIPVSFWGLCLSPQYGAFCGLSAYIGLMIPHAKFQRDSSLVSALGMETVLMARLALILAPVAFIYPTTLIALLVGFLGGFPYLIGWTFLGGIDSGISTKGFRFLGIDFQAGRFAVTGSEWGEVLTGVVFGAALGLAMVIKNG